MFGSYFSPADQGAIAASVVLTLSACIAHVRQRERLALGLLLLAALALRLMSSQLDPYLNTWDESVHAVVAKNMVAHPFTPMLYSDPALGLGYDQWIFTRIWLHKQPFFLWAMALSIGTFGNTVFALRLPMVLFTTALVYFTYSIGRAMHGRHVAFPAAMLMAWSSWFLMLVVGAICCDHNDAIFISLVGGSFWAWFRWRDRMTSKRAVVIGLFMGCAVLTKWLPGFLLMGGWAFVALLEKERRWREFRWMATAFLSALLIAVPWQISAWMRFPEEMAHETALNGLHLWTVVEGHEGDAWFYFRTIAQQFDPFNSKMVYGALLLSIIFTRRRDLRTMALVSVVLTYGFYSFAATKMSAFTMIVVPFLFIGLGWVISLSGKILRPKLFRQAAPLVLSLVAAGALFHMERIQETHTTQALSGGYYGWYRSSHLHNLAEVDSLQRFLGPAENVVIYNVPFPANMNMMFLHGHQALPINPSVEQVKRLQGLGRTVVVVNPSKEMLDDLPSKTRYCFTGEEGFIPTPP